MKYIKTTLIILALLLGAFTLWSIFYPEKGRETRESLEAVGSVGLSRVLSAMEERVGRSDVALEHYKRALQAQRESLISLKALKRDCEQKQPQEAYAEQLARLTESISRAESTYREAMARYDAKKLELKSLRERSSMLQAELMAGGGGDAARALSKARELEEEIRSECSRIEAEIDVRTLEESHTPAPTAP